MSDFLESLSSLSIDAWPIAGVIVFVILDIITGWGAAYATSTVQSSKMREGLMHKAVYFVLIVLFVAVELAQQHFEIWPDFPTSSAVCVYICVTEILSIVENASIINPEIASWPIIKNLVASKHTSENSDVVESTNEEAAETDESEAKDA